MSRFINQLIAVSGGIAVYVLLIVLASSGSLALNWQVTSGTGTSCNIGLLSGGSFRIGNRNAGAGDTVGAFFLRGTDTLCAGYYVFGASDYGWTVWGDDATTDIKDGLASGENIIFMASQYPSGKRARMYPTFLTGNATFVPNGLSVISSFRTSNIDGLPDSWTFLGQGDYSFKIKLMPSGNYTFPSRSITAGDAVGAFYMSGADTLCGAYIIWNGANYSMTVYSDAPGTSAKDGFAFGETILYKIFDRATSAEYFAAPTVASGYNTFAQGDSVTINELITAYKRSFTLLPGWNIVSSNIVPLDSSFAGIAESAVGNIKYAVGYLNAFYSKNETNQIAFWRTGDVFRIYCGDTSRVNFFGKKVLPRTVALTAGKNLVAYLAESEKDPVSVFAGISSNILSVTNRDGLIYSPPYGIKQFDKMKPGEGYIVVSKSACNLTYEP